MKNKVTIASLSFDITSGVITTLGLMVGLNSGTDSRIAVIGGVLTIALVDAFSDSFGMHMHEESESNGKSTWFFTVSTFLAKFVTALTFLFALAIFNLKTAVIINILYGLFIIAVFSYFMAKESKSSVYKVILEHLLLSVAIVAITHFLGTLIRSFF